MEPALKIIERKIEEGVPLSFDDGLALFRTPYIHSLGRLARAQKERKSGKNVYYVLNRYINSTNVCYANCKFCAFAVDEFKEKDRVVRMPADEVFDKAFETGTNFNQLHIVGGHDPRQLSLDYWLPLMRRFKARAPHVQLSLFTAAEIEYMAKRHRMSFAQMITTLKEAGLDNVNGGGAEIFAPETRAKICPNKVSADNWLAIHEELHR
ncbi:MAG: aminofutalosine synthase MqnE, partial [Candidatus Eremiobacteraeota bacterium]|nr:aminofutalosine synthase MqnE [Candidatus Eremiobacteraeota bacterium]